jgi:hypothetical protein
MTSMVEQFNQLKTRISEEESTWTPQQRQDIASRVLAVEQALDDDGPVGGGIFVDAEDCRDWMIAQGQGSTYANLQFTAWCDNWAYLLDAKITYLREGLADVSPNLAGLAGALGDRSETARHQADDVVPDSLGEVWENTPGWAKVAIPLTLVFFLWYTPRAIGAGVKAST